MNVKKASTAQLKKIWNKHKNEKKPAPVFAQQLKNAAAELKKRGEKLDENNLMSKFDKAVKSIMESVKTVKEGRSHDEYDYEVDLNNDSIEGVLVSEVLPNDPAGDDVFVITASIAMPYTIEPGEPRTWEDPGSDPGVEIDDVVFHNIKLFRYSQDQDKYLDVTPESIGQEAYNTVLAKLKAQAQEAAVNDAYENIDTRYADEY